MFLPVDESTPKKHSEICNIMATLRLGTRGSPLAMWQAHFVRDRLLHLHPGLTIDLVEIQTEGDQIRNIPLAQMGGFGVFTKAIQQALLDNRVDLAVHSLKDLPTLGNEGLFLAAVPERAATGDAFISVKHRRFDDLPQGAVVATSSLRRKAQILNRRPDLRLVDIRGNVDTRLRKLVEQDLDATILAEAGLLRLGLGQHITEILKRSWMLPAVGQGALGIECRGDDAATRNYLEPLNHVETRWSVLAERAMLRALQGGCQIPIGTTTDLQDGQLTLHGVVLPADGSRRIEAKLTSPQEQAEELGKLVADRLRSLGAEELLRA